jgi:hypothetical protein
VGIHWIAGQTPPSQDEVQSLFERIGAVDTLDTIVTEHVALSAFAITSIAKQARLRELSVTDASLNDSACEELSKIKTLEALAIDGNNITNAGVNKLLSLGELTCLGLDRTQVRPGIGGSCAALRKVKILRLGGCQLNEDDLAALSRSPSLQSLNLADSHLPPTAFDILGDHELWTELNLSGLGVTDAGIRKLRGLRYVGKLYLLDSKLTDSAGLELLEKPLLKELWISSPSITDEFVAKFTSRRRMQGKCWRIEAP